jgi:RNA polymerase sigma-70 factor (ECF subfamily)
VVTVEVDENAAEAAAVASAVAGDSAAFGVLVERYQQAAFRTAWLLLRDSHAAEDVAQEAFVRAYRQLSTFRREEAFRPWLLRIVHNLALNEIRSRKRRGGMLDRLRIATPRVAEEPPHRQVEAADESSQLLRAIDELPEDDRIVLHLRYFMELPEREIAATIGRPAGTVKSRLHRASQRLRHVIETKYPHLREAADG